jgi:CRISPR-associated protein Cst1
MLHYTGHPFVDVGMAAITAFANKTRPEDVTADDLEQVASYIEQNYVRPPLRGHLTMAFTSNAWFIQDAYNPDKPDLAPEDRAARQATRADWAARHLRQWQAPGSDDEHCIFTGLPVVPTTLSGKLPGGRAGRAQIPLVQGDDVINFFTYGNSGLPIAGIALLALQFFPLGCAKCGVGLLAVHSDNDRLTYELTRRFLVQNISDVTKAQAAGEDKLPGAQRSLKTLLIEALLEAEQRRSRSEQRAEPASVTAYNFNNGKTPSLELYHLPLEIVSFLQVVYTEPYRDAWNQVVQRAWERIATKKGKQAASPHATEPRRNYLYEDLFDLLDMHEHIVRFIRVYFLRIPRHTAYEEDPRRQYSLHDEWSLVSWPLVELFLGKVVRMDEDRIKRICALGDGLAVYVQKQGGKRFFRNFFIEQNASNFRAMLIKANIAHIKAGYEPLFDLHTYIDVFEEGEDVMRPDWRLARDLVFMRMIDQLRSWLAQNPDAVPDVEAETEPAGSIAA